MHTIKALFVGFAALLLGACSTVYSPVPFGETRLALEPADWEGQWLHAEGFAVIEAADAENGVLEVLWVDDAERQEFVIHVLKSGDWTFASMLEESGDSGSAGVEEHETRGGKPSYMWFRMENKGDYLVFWAPDGDRFAALVEDGSLPGTIRKSEGFMMLDDVYLEELSAEQYRLITHSENGLLLDWEEPYVLMRFRD